MRKTFLEGALKAVKRFISQHRGIMFCLGFVIGLVIAEFTLWGPLDFLLITIMLAIIATLSAPRIFVPSIIAGGIFAATALLSVHKPFEYLGAFHLQNPLSSGLDPPRHNSQRPDRPYYSSLNSERSQFSEVGVVETLPRYRKPGLIELVVKTNNKRLILCKAPDLPWRNSTSVKVGDVIFFKGNITKLNPAEGVLSYERGLLREGIEAKCQIEWLTIKERKRSSWNESLIELGANLRNSIEKLVIPQQQSSEAVGLFFALTLGARDRVSQETERAFRILGLSHLLVLSGYQISLVFFVAHWIIFQILTRFWPVFISGPNLLATSVALGLSALLTVISGLEKPALRAIYALLVAQIALLRGPSSSVANQISVAVLCLLVCSRASIIDPSIDLTLAAVIGIAIGNKGSTVSRYLWSNWCATSATGVVSLIWFGEWSWIALVINPLLAPVLGILPICAFSLLLILSLIGDNILPVASEVILNAISLARDELVNLAYKVPQPDSSDPLYSSVICISIISVAIARRKYLGGP